MDKKSNVVSILVSVAVLVGTVFAISWAWKKGQK